MKNKKDNSKVRTLVYRPKQEPVIKEIEPTQEAFETLLDNGWVQHAQPWDDLYVWLLRNKYAQEDGLPYNRTMIDIQGNPILDLYGTFALVGLTFTADGFKMGTLHDDMIPLLEKSFVTRNLTKRE